jgi:hypothetical protein
MPGWMWPFLVAFFTFALAGLASVVGFAYTVYIKFSDRISRIEGDVNTSKAQLVPLAALIQSSLLAVVHHDNPRFKECDDLIDQFKDLSIDRPAGLARLNVLLAEREIDMTVTEKERYQAAALRNFMRIVVIETEERRTTMDGLTSACVSGLFWAITMANHLTRLLKF